MGPRPTTIIVDPRLLIRKALKSLMTESSYRVVCEVGSISGIGLPTIDRDEPGLVILSAQSADIALIEPVGARRLWPDSKIILLYENASPADFQKLLTSELNGCVSWFVSPETLISTLDLIVTRDLRLMVGANANDPVIQPVPPYEPHPSERGTEKREGVSEGGAINNVCPRFDVSGADRARGPDPGWSRERAQQSDDRAHVRCHGGNGQGSHEVDPAEDPGKKPHAGGSLGNGERQYRLNLLGCAAPR